MRQPFGKTRGANKASTGQWREWADTMSVSVSQGTPRAPLTFAERRKRVAMGY